MVNDALIVAENRKLIEIEKNPRFIDTRKVDFLLRPNDVVYVGENKLYKAGRFMQQAALVLAPFTEAASIVGTARKKENSAAAFRSSF